MSEGTSAIQIARERFSTAERIVLDAQKSLAAAQRRAQATSDDLDLAIICDRGDPAAVDEAKLALAGSIERCLGESEVIAGLEDKVIELSSSVARLERMLYISMNSHELKANMAREERFAVYHGGEIDDELTAFVIFSAQAVTHDLIRLNDIIFQVQNGQIIFDRLPPSTGRMHKLNPPAVLTCNISARVALVDGRYQMPASDVNYQIIMKCPTASWTAKLEAYRKQQREDYLARGHRFF